MFEVQLLHLVIKFLQSLLELLINFPDIVLGP